MVSWKFGGMGIWVVWISWKSSWSRKHVKRPGLFLPGQCVDLHRHLAFVFPGSGKSVESWANRGNGKAKRVFQWLDAKFPVKPSTATQVDHEWIDQQALFWKCHVGKQQFQDSRSQIRGYLWEASCQISSLRSWNLAENPPFIDDFPDIRYWKWPVIVSFLLQIVICP